MTSSDPQAGKPAAEGAVSGAGVPRFPRIPIGKRERATLAEGRGGLVGVKAGMTQVFGEDGSSLAVTVIRLVPNIVTQVMSPAKNGYVGVQVGVLPRSSVRSKPEHGMARKVGARGFYQLTEFRLPDTAKVDGGLAGKLLSPEFLKAGDWVDLTAVSKGKGFQGGMKRFHMSGNYKSHGCSVSHRQLGSIGNRADPGKCFKNKKMAGQMGGVRRTVQNVKVVRVDSENGVLLVHGSVPGPKSGFVRIRRAVKAGVG